MEKKKAPSTDTREPLSAQTSTATIRPLDDFLDEATLARLLKVSRSTVCKWRKDGLPAYKFGQRWWYRESQVVEWFDKQLLRPETAHTGAPNTDETQP